MAMVTSQWPFNSGLHPFISTNNTSAIHHRPLPSYNVSSQLYNHSQTPPQPPPTTQLATLKTSIDKSSLRVSEAHSDAELWAAACLRVRAFHKFPEQSYAIQDHKKYLAEREFQAMQERIAGNNSIFRKVFCINATLPLSQISSISDDLCDSCKFPDVGEERVVVGTLDLNQCVRLPDEITGSKPKGIGADFARAYLSNVCVAGELLRNGLAYALIMKSKVVAEKMGELLRNGECNAPINQERV